MSAGGRGNATTCASEPDACAWEDIAAELDGRTAMQCMERWQKVLNAENVKGPWCPTEDAQLVELVKQYGGKHWARIASMLPGRTGKQCRERWCNNLDPTLKKGSWTPQEDMIILEMHAKLGTRWAEIAKSLPGRSDNSVKNRWYSTCSRIMRQQQEMAGFELRRVQSTDAVGATMALGVAGEDAAAWASEWAGSGPATPLTPGGRRPESQNSGSMLPSSPRTKRKLGGSGTPTSESSPPMITDRPYMPMGVSHAPEALMANQDWKVGARAPHASLTLPGSWPSLAVRLPQPGELRADEPVLSAEID